jgi:hypothetical protein
MKYGLGSLLLAGGLVLSLGSGAAKADSGDAARHRLAPLHLDADRD